VRPRLNLAAIVIAFAPAVLMPFVQDVIRPAAPHTGLIAVVLGSAPDFIAAFCFPFSILMRRAAFSQLTQKRLFRLWCVIALGAIFFDEIYAPVGPNVFDVNDIAAGVLGVALAYLIGRRWAGNNIPNEARSATPIDQPTAKI